MKLTAYQYKVLRELSRSEGTVRNIAAKAGVSLGTVVSFKRACAAVDHMTPLLQEKIRRLLWSKMKSSRIAATLNIPIEDVRALRRLDRYRESPSGASECDECGTRFFAPIAGHERSAVSSGKWNPSQENLTDILQVVRDLLDLSDLFLITHPLFHHLSQRAEKAYRKIYGKENSGRTCKVGNPKSPNETEVD
jgi:hypothetical protein